MSTLSADCLSGVQVRRVLFGSTARCPASCQYCFAAMKEFSPPLPMLLGGIEKGCTVVYPYCDGEICLDPVLRGNIARLLCEDGAYSIISVSTKADLDERFVRDIQQVNEQLMRARRGYIRVGISMTSVSMIAEIEPGTADWKQRMRSLKLLHDYEVPRCIVLKPMLPFVAPDEYRRIVDSTAKYTQYYLMGGLYVSRSTDFYTRYIERKHPVTRREVSWLRDRPVWDYVESADLQATVKRYIHSNGLRAFDSDLALIRDLTAQILITEETTWHSR